VSHAGALLAGATVMRVTSLAVTLGQLSFVISLAYMSSPLTVMPLHPVQQCWQQGVLIQRTTHQLIPYYGPALSQCVCKAPEGARSIMALPDTLQLETFTLYVTLKALREAITLAGCKLQQQQVASAH